MIINVQTCSEFFKHIQMETPIIKERFSPEIKTFTKAEFLEYLGTSSKSSDGSLIANKDELAKYSTYKLNKMFSINGYRITKLKKEITLIADQKRSNMIENDQKCSKTIENDQKRPNVVEAIKILDEKITYVIEVLREHGWIESD
jgi:hypothetical protein